jgi:hypothetical protein
VLRDMARCDRRRSLLRLHTAHHRESWLMPARPTSAAETKYHTLLADIKPGWRCHAVGHVLAVRGLLREKRPAAPAAAGGSLTAGQRSVQRAAAQGQLGRGLGQVGQQLRWRREDATTHKAMVFDCERL